MNQASVLFVDDDDQVRGMFMEAIRSEPWRVAVAGNGQEALDRLGAGSFDVTVLDLMMPRLNGLEVLEAIGRQKLRTEVVMLTGYGTIDTAVRAMKLGAREFLLKPVDLSGLLGAIRGLIEKRFPSPHVLAGRMDRFLEERAGQPSLRLTDLCAHFRISVRYASRLFRAHLGGSFRERLLHHRLEKARDLIASTNDPMNLIADRCGFTSAPRFSGAFRREAGVSPRQYRENCVDRHKDS